MLAGREGREAKYAVGREEEPDDEEEGEARFMNDGSGARAR